MTDVTEKSTVLEEIEALKLVVSAVEALSDAGRAFVIGAVIDRLAIPGLGRRGAEVKQGKGATNGNSSAARENAGGGADDGDEEREDATSSELPDDPKDFLKDKKPATDTQRVAVLAYYLAHKDGVREFKPADLTTLNTKAAGRKLSNTPLTVKNAVRDGFFASATEGRKQLAPHGEEVVQALPDLAEVQRVTKEHKERSGARRRAKVSKAPKGAKAGKK